MLVQTAYFQSLKEFHMDIRAVMDKCGGFRGLVDYLFVHFRYDNGEQAFYSMK